MTEPLQFVHDDDITWVGELLKLQLDATRESFLRRIDSVDVAACPGSGKTTLVVAKLAVLAQKWTRRTSGICVLSHTNVAREEIEKRLGNSDVGRRLLGYPHHIDTIHGFVNRFLAVPWLLSNGHRITAIDDGITASVRRKSLGSDYGRLKFFLESKQRSFDTLRLASADLRDPLRGSEGGFPSGPHTDMYKLASAALQDAAQQGYFCHDEMLLFGETMLARHPDVTKTLCQRFPYVLIDEVQDSSVRQTALLDKVFPRHLGSSCVQRVGDSNQSIYERAADGTGGFPDTDRHIQLDSSYRFGAAIAKLASGFAYTPVQPNGLHGKRLEVEAPAHTVFVFPDDDASKVLDNFGQLVLDRFSRNLVRSGVVTAVGGVHKPFPDVAPGHSHYPKTVCHYWTQYNPAVTPRRLQAETFPEILRDAQRAVKSGLQISDCVDGVASGIVHIARRLSPTVSLPTQSRPHRQLKKILTSMEDANRDYHRLLAEVVLGEVPLDETGWAAVRPLVLRVASALGGRAPGLDNSDSYLRWPAALVDDEPLPAAGSPPLRNAYRCCRDSDYVDIHLSSIHAVKGQTHLATLVLETYNRAHFFDKLMPWLLGKHRNGTKCKGDAAANRLRLAYVAMTRPTHLLCIAMRRSTLGSGTDAEKREKLLREQGWIVKRLG